MTNLIKTDAGLNTYSGIRRIKYKEYYYCKFSNGKELKCSVNHPFITFNGTILAKNLSSKNEIFCERGTTFLLYKKKINKEIYLYDALNTKNNTYYTNGILSHNCEFLGSTNTLIGPTKLKAMSWVPPLQKSAGVDIYQFPRPDRQYMIMVDTSEGQNLDYSAFVVIDVTNSPYRLVAKYKNNQISPMMFPNIIYNVARKYNSAHILVETNNIGSQVAENLHVDLEYENLFATTNLGRGGQKISAGFKKNAKLGVKTTAPMKSLGCSNLKSIIEGDQLIIQDFDIIAELTSFVATGQNYSAEPGCHDDLVMCLVMFGWLAAQPLFKELTDIDIRKRIIHEQEQSINEQLMPFGVMPSEQNETRTYTDQQGTIWDYANDWEGQTRFWKEIDYVFGDNQPLSEYDD